MTTVTQQSIVNPQVRFANRWDSRLCKTASGDAATTFRVNEVDHHKVLRFELGSSNLATVDFADPVNCVGVELKGFLPSTAAGNLHFDCSAGAVASDFSVIQLADSGSADFSVVTSLASTDTLTTPAAGTNFSAISDGHKWYITLHTTTSGLA